MLVALGVNQKVTILIFVSFLLTGLNCFAQTNSADHKVNLEIPEVALLGLVSETSTSININTNAPSEAGQSVDFNISAEKGVWLNYSSIVSKSGLTRKIVATVNGEIPSGLVLKVEASEVIGSGKGKLGKTAGSVSLSGTPTDVIVDIGSCYTGKGVSNGHYLTYSLESDASSNDLAMLAQSHSSFDVVYTISDCN